jgi:ABC-type branched-subunit amino acid transport system substrate-binding protein
VQADRAKRFGEVERLHSSGAIRTAILATDEFLARDDGETDSYTARVQAFRGDLEAQRGDLEAALTWYEEALGARELLPPKFLAWTLLRKAQGEAELGEEARARKTVSEITMSLLERPHQSALHELRARLALWQGQPQESLTQVLEGLRLQPADLARLRPIWEAAIEAIRGSEPLLALHATNLGGPLSDRLLFEAIVRLQHEERHSAAQVESQLFLRHYSKSRFAEQVRRWAQGESPGAIESARTIGLIVPKQGKWAELGQQLERAARLALEGRGVRLISEDGGQTDAEMLAAFDKLALEQRVHSVLGPFFTQGSEAVAKRAEALGIPTLLLSRADPPPNGYAFQFGLTHRQQARALIQYLQKKKKTPLRFALLGPASTKGDSELAAFWQEVDAAGGEVRAHLAYPTTQADFQEPLARLTGMTEVEAREAWGEPLLAPTHSPRSSASGRTKKNEKKSRFALPPVVDFDAVWIADEGAKAASLIPTFRYLGIGGFAVLGPSTWGAPRARKLLAGLAEETYYSDLVSLSALNSGTREFRKRFSLALGFEPAAHHALAFDAATFLGGILADLGPKASRQRIRDALVDSEVFDGVTGRIRFRTDGADREAVVYPL